MVIGIICGTVVALVGITVGIVAYKRHSRHNDDDNIQGTGHEETHPENRHFTMEDVTSPVSPPPYTPNPCTPDPYMYSSNVYDDPSYATISDFDVHCSPPPYSSLEVMCPSSVNDTSISRAERLHKAITVDGRPARYSPPPSYNVSMHHRSAPSLDDRPNRNRSDEPQRDACMNQQYHNRADYLRSTTHHNGDTTSIVFDRVDTDGRDIMTRRRASIDAPRESSV